MGDGSMVYTRHLDHCDALHVIAGENFEIFEGGWVQTFCFRRQRLVCAGRKPLIINGIQVFRQHFVTSQKPLAA
jgi:hypothetical protein